MTGAPESIGDLVADIVTCRRCPRLVEWRERVASERVARHRDSVYWGRPVPGFGDPAARLLVVGLAPAAHGANRTGRVFTGDSSGVSGELLFRALHHTGYSQRERSVAPDDGLQLDDCYIAAGRVILALGAYGGSGVLRTLAAAGHAVRPKPKFGHGAEASVDSYTLLGCYHPSQQNTFTGKLTPEMVEDVLRRARAIAEGG